MKRYKLLVKLTNLPQEAHLVYKRYANSEQEAKENLTKELKEIFDTSFEVTEVAEDKTKTIKPA